MTRHPQLLTNQRELSHHSIKQVARETSAVVSTRVQDNLQDPLTMDRINVVWHKGELEKGYSVDVVVYPGLVQKGIRNLRVSFRTEPTRELTRPFPDGVGRSLTTGKGLGQPRRNEAMPVL